MQKQSNNDQNTYYRSFKAKNRVFDTCKSFLNVYNIPLDHICNIFTKKDELGSKGYTTKIKSKNL